MSIWCFKLNDTIDKGGGLMASNEELNEEAAQNNNIPPSAKVDDLITLNEMNDRHSQLPKLKDQRFGFGIKENVSKPTCK
jgi:hypothetical protein